MNPTRVFVVDDSAVVRHLVTKALEAASTIRVVGTAANGRAALPQIIDLRPEVVVMDVDMPEMDGIQTLAALKAAGQRTPVIMLSTHTQRGAAVTLDALFQGASDYLPKPVTSAGPGQTLDYFRTELVPKIRALAQGPTVKNAGVSPAEPARSVPAGGSGERRLGPPLSGEAVRPAPSGERRFGPPLSGEAARPAPSGERRVPAAGKTAAPARPEMPLTGPVRPVGVVVVGVSTGGPAALAALLPLLPADLSVPVLIVLHMPPIFTRLLADRLAADCRLPVVEAAAGEPVLPGRVYLAPGGWHMSVTGGRTIGLTQDPPENFCRPAVDVLFRSAAREYGPEVLAVVLTGMGNDGTKGCEAVRTAGGRVLVQDQATSVVWGMPGSVVRAGLAADVLPLDRIPAAIVCRTRAGRPPVVAPAVDRRAALDRLGGDEELYAEVAALFRSDAPATMADIRRAVAAGAADGVQRGAHGLKGAALYVGGTAAAAAAQALEKIGAAGDLTHAPAALAGLAREIDRLTAALAAPAVPATV